MATPIRRNFGQFLSHLNQKYTYDMRYRPGLFVIKFFVAMKLVDTVSARAGYWDWLNACRKVNSPEVRLEMSERRESTIGRLEKMNSEVEEIKRKQRQSKKQFHAPQSV